VGKLSWLDGAIVLATLLLAVGAGLVLGRKAGSARAWLVGERDVPWWAILLSIVATETSSVTFLSVPGVAFTGDLRFLQLPLGYLLGRLVVARLFLPLYFEGDALTSYEVLGRRFGPGVKRASSLLFLVTRSVADGLRLYLTALPLKMLTGMPLAAAIALMGAVTVAYTFAGGMRAVVWTDVVQFFVYVAGGLLALSVAVGDVTGGLGGVLQLARDHGKLRLFDFAFALDHADLFWAGLIGGAFLTLATHGTDQLMVQRYLCARNAREAGRALVASGVVVLAQFALFLLLGLALFAWFRDHPPAAPIRSDDVFPTFISQRLTQLPGAVGLILGALFAVSMSTLSSSLNSSAAAAVNDWLKPTVGRSWDDARTLRVTRGAMVAFALVQVGCGVAGAAFTESVVKSVLAIASFTTGPTLGLFFLARALRAAPAGSAAARAQGRAALIAFVAALAVMTWVWRGTSLAWPWYAVVGSLGTLVLGLVAARLSSARS